MADSELERVFITFLANDKDLERTYQKIVSRAKQVSAEVSKSFEVGASKGFTDAGVKVERSAKQQAKAVDDTKEAFERLRNETAALRNTTEAGETSTRDAIKRFRELQSEAIGNANAFDVTSKEYRQFTQVAAQASRSVATLEGRTTKLGFSANAAVGITAAINQNLGRMGPAGNVAGTALGIVSREMSALTQLNPAQLLRGIASSMSVVTVAAAGLAAAAVAGLTAALFKMGTAAAESADKIDKGRQAAGLSVEAYQELRYVFDQNGVAADKFDKSLQTLNRRLGLAAQGEKTYVDAFERLGIALRDNEGAVRDTEAVFTDAIAALERLPSSAEKAAAASELFGDRIGAELLPALNQGVEGFDRLRTAAREMGLIVSGDAVMNLVEFKDAVATLKQQFETAKIEILAGFMPVFTNLLIPILQNTVVPWIQRAAERVDQFSTSLRDTSAAGREFRVGLAESFAPVVSFLGYLQAAGASLDVLNYKVQLNGAQMNQFWRDLGQGITGLPDAVKRFLGIEVSAPMSGGRDSSGETQLVQQAKANLAAAEALLADAIYKIENPGEITLAWLEGIAADVRDGVSAFNDLGDAANDANAALGKMEPPPVGSLAALQQEVADAQRAFNLAITDEDRRAAKEREAIAQATIDSILETYRSPDILKDAKVWTARLSAELREGVKTGDEVAELLVAGIDVVRERASQAFDDFGWDSQEYRTAITQLEFLEGFLKSIKVDATAIGEVTLRGLQSEILALTREGVDPASEAIKELLRQMSELELKAALGELSTKGVSGLSTWALGVLQANGLLADAVKQVDLTAAAIAVSAEVIERPLAATLFAMHKFASDASDDFTHARESWDDFANGVALGAHQVDAALRVPAAAARSFVDTWEAMKASGADAAELASALTAFPAFAPFMMTGPGGTPAGDVAAQTPLLKAALDAQAEAWAAVQAAMTEEQLIEAGKRHQAATAEVERLRELYSAATLPAPTMTTGDSITAVLANMSHEFRVAEAAALAFGDSSGLAAEKQRILETAIKAILDLNPAADVQALVAEWERLNVESADTAAGMSGLASVAENLQAAMARLQELTAEAPSEWDQLRAAFEAAAAQGFLTRQELERLLEVINDLERTSGAATRLQELAGSIDLGTMIGTGLTDALEGIRDGNLDSVLSGLTDIGVAIGTAIGGPAVGAIVGAIGQAVQALPALFQVISDLFTGDSPARRELASSLTSTVENAMKAGIEAGLRGADDWRETFRTDLRESIVDALVDAFIEASVTQAIIAPFIDEFTKILHRQGQDAALAFLSGNLNAIISEAEGAAAGIIRIFDRYYEDLDRTAAPRLDASTFSLPDATVSILAAPQWALELGVAAERIGAAGERMIEAAELMHSTFQSGINVNTQSTRGVDAQRAAL